MIWTFSRLGWLLLFSRMDELAKTVEVSGCGNKAQDLTELDVHSLHYVLPLMQMTENLQQSSALVGRYNWKYGRRL